MNEILDNSTLELLNYGVLGIFCIFLTTILVFLWNYLKKREDEYMKRTDEFTTCMKEYSVNEAQQTEVLRSLKEIIQSLINGK